MEAIVKSKGYEPLFLKTEAFFLLLRYSLNYDDCE